MRKMSIENNQKENPENKDFEEKDEYDAEECNCEEDCENEECDCECDDDCDCEKCDCECSKAPTITINMALDNSDINMLSQRIEGHKHDLSREIKQHKSNFIVKLIQIRDLCKTFYDIAIKTTEGKNGFKFSSFEEFGMIYYQNYSMRFVKKNAPTEIKPFNFKNFLLIDWLGIQFMYEEQDGKVMFCVLIPVILGEQAVITLNDTLNNNIKEVSMSILPFGNVGAVYDGFNVDYKRLIHPLDNIINALQSALDNHYWKINYPAVHKTINF